jgi:ribose 5-phosphate isomerase B
VKVACGFDHAGYPLKQEVLEIVREAGHEPLDLGTDSTEPVDYPEIALAVGRAIASGEAERGVLVCGSGAGVSIAAGKLPGIKAATVHDEYTAHQGVEHDDLNVICLGARVIGSELAGEIIERYLGATFSGAERHRRRVAKSEALERDGLDAALDAITADDGPPPGAGG